MPALLFPFPRLFSDIVVDIDSVRVDGEALPAHNINQESRTIALFASGRKEWREAQVLVRAQVPLQELKGKSLDNSSTRALIRINCDATNLRSGSLVDLKDGIAEVSLRFRREQVAERATLECFVVRDSEDGFARILRETQSWQAVFSEPQARKIASGKRRGGVQEFVQIKWEDFASGDAAGGALTPHSREAYFFDLMAEPPVLYLNSSIDGYRTLLDSDTGPASEAERVFRELEYKRISLGVWLALCVEAVSCIRRDPETDALELPDGWKREVLQMVLPRIYPGESIDAASRKIAVGRGDDGSLAFLFGRLQVAVNDLIAASTTLKKHLLALTREGS